MCTVLYASCCRMTKKESPRLNRYMSRSEASMPHNRSPFSDGGSISLPSIRSTTRQSVRSYNRSTMGSRLYLPSDFDTPGPDSYSIKSTIGSGPGPVFKGDRSRSFAQAKSSNALFLLPRLANATPAPGDYQLNSSIGKGQKNTFSKSRRDSRFAGDRNSNATFLLQRYDDPSPAPTRYNMKSSMGGQQSLFTQNTTLSPGATFSRAKRDARFNGDRNAKFLLPRIVPQHPAPDKYNTEHTFSFGKNAKGGSFGRQRRTARFPGDSKAKFLLMESARRPNSFSHLR